MQIGKLVLIHKVLPMVKDDHNQVIQLIHHRLLPPQHNIPILVGIIIKPKVLKDQQINIITDQIHQMVHQVHLPIKHQLVTIISRPIRHLRPITIVNKNKPRAKILYSLSSPFSLIMHVCVLLVFCFLSISYICMMPRYNLKKTKFLYYFLFIEH
jgi:hypothetical protein